MTRVGTKAATPYLVAASPYLIVAAAVIGLGSINDNPYGHRILALTGVYALLGIGYQAIFGQAGALSLAQGAFFGLGAYVAGIFGIRLGASLAVTLPAAVCATTVLAALVGAPLLRLKTHYLALATLGLAHLLLLAAQHWETVTGGENGLAGVPAPSLFGASVSQGWAATLVGWTAAAAGAIAFAVLIGRRRRQFEILREAPLAAAAVGIDASALRLRAFVFSAACAGVAGGLQVHFVGVVSPETLRFEVMATCLAIVVIGGRTSLAGVMLAAILLLHLPEWFRFLEQQYPIAYGLGMLLVVLIAPNGLSGILPAEMPPAAPPAAGRPGSQRFSAPAADRSGASALTGINLVKRYGGVTAVDDVSLDLAPGAITGLIGPNGSGKTSLLNLLSGAARPDAGRIEIRAEDASDAPAFRRARLGLARSFQVPALPAEASAAEAVAAVGAALPDANAALRRVGFPAALDAIPCRDLPHGRRRQVDIARALATEPTYLLLDEPTAGMAPDERLELAGLLRGLAARGIGCLVVDHTLDFLTAISDRLVCMNQGRIIADGAPDQVASAPAVRAAYLGD